jgi:xanthine dehydrogenase YagS FAD-binding subunit
VLPRFAYARPRSLEEAVRLLSEPDARVHAGGTDLLGCLRDRVFTAGTLVSLSGLSELAGIEERPDGSLRIGARTTLAEVASHPAIVGRFTALAEGAGAAASPQLRNQGTLGGNLCQRPRCVYFRGDFPCARKGGDVCFALQGENELHAIFGGAGCHFVHPSDTAAPLVALEARVRIEGPAGGRTLPLEQFLVPPSQDLTRETVLERGELLTEILLPAPLPGLRSLYRKVRARGAWDFALAGLALALRREGGRVARARLVLSGVAPIPWRARDAEAWLAGRPLGTGTAEAAGELAARGAEPLEQNAYKIDLVRGLVEGTLLTLS